MSNRRRARHYRAPGNRTLCSGVRAGLSRVPDVRNVTCSQCLAVLAGAALPCECGALMTAGADPVCKRAPM